MKENEIGKVFADIKIAIPQINNVFLDISEELKKLGKRLSDSYPEMEQSAIRLGESGWTLPMKLTPGQTIGLGRLNDEESIDKWFIDFYTENNNKELYYLFERLKKTSYCSKRIGLLEQCIDNYAKGNYLISVPALILMLEGALLNSCSLLNTGAYDIKKETNKKLKQYKSGGVHTLIWLSIKSFVDNLFASADFSSKEPGKINRNWILHGRSEFNYNISDNIRLYNALSTICLK